MLVEFSVENFLSFKDKVTLSMVASKDDSLKDNMIKISDKYKFDLVKNVALYGANASGKSNLLKALLFMAGFAIKSTKGQQDTPIKVIIPFKLDESCWDKPSTFEVYFIQDDVLWEYGFSLTGKYVQHEWLANYPKRKRRLLFERNQESYENEPHYNYGAFWDKNSREDFEKRTRKNSLFLTVAGEFNNEDAGKVLAWFNKIKGLFSSNFNAFFNRMLLEIGTIEYINENQENKDFVLDLIKKADLGILDFNVEVTKLDNTNMSKQLPYSLMKKENDIELRVNVRTKHKLKKSDKSISSIDFDLQEESNGTQRFFQISGPFSDVLNNGYIFVVDELEDNLHPLLIKWLIRLFNNKEYNQKNAQLIFATHDSSILKNDLFRRDQIWFTEKKQDDSTDLYSLWDIKKSKGTARKDDSYEKRYLEGRYGAIPFLGDF